MTVRKLARSEEELHEAASRKAGLSDFGDPAYREGLRVLLEALDGDLQLTDAGWQAAYEWNLRTLIARLHTERGWRKHPEVFTMPLQRPLVITGLPRTGTTALHRLLSVDPQFQGLETWLVHAPMVRPPRDTWKMYPAYRACVATFEDLYTRMPGLRKAHDFAIAEVEECTEVLQQNFVSRSWLAGFSLPTYGRWLISQSALGSYQRYVNVLRLIGAREPHKRWLLKSPHHMAEIETLLQVFPDALIIQTHRDPLKAIPSYCNLVHMFGRDWEGEAAQPNIIGPRQCTYWGKALERMRAARQRSPKQFFDVDHRRFVLDPLAIVHSIYDYFGLVLSRDIEQHMRAWVADGPTSKHGGHQYPIDTWGVTPAHICDAFADYRAEHQFS